MRVHKFYQKSVPKPLVYETVKSGKKPMENKKIYVEIDNFNMELKIWLWIYCENEPRSIGASIKGIVFEDL